MQSFVLTEEQQMLGQTAHALVEETSPLTRIRRLRDSEDLLGYTPAVWNRMVELGWTGIPFSEEDGGLGMGLSELVLVTEALGRGLVPEPFISTVALAGRALSRAEHSKSRLIKSVIAGTTRVALAFEEPGKRFSLEASTTEAVRTQDGYVLTGERAQVLDGAGADVFIVSARTSSGMSLFLVNARAQGVSVTRLSRLDARNAAHLRFTNVTLGEADVLAGSENGSKVLQEAVDYATVALCGEMLGSMAKAFELTLDYLKQRKQFGRIIGSFQALQHRAAKIYIEHELARSAVMAAARHVDASSPLAGRYVSAAKARCNDAFLLTANEAVQMHGGIGMTDEHDIGFFLKRARVAEMTFGDSAFHRHRFANIAGY